MKYCVDFDDLCDATAGELDTIARLKEKYPALVVTLFTIPMRTSEFVLRRARKMGDWVKIAPHGWRHTKGECLAWDADEAVAKILLAGEMGIDYEAFRAPGWLLDGDVYAACKELGYVVASHRVFRIPYTNVPEYVYNLRIPGMRRHRSVHGHLTPVCDNYIRDMISDGRLDLRTDAEFTHPTELASIVTAPAAMLTEDFG